VTTGSAVCSQLAVSFARLWIFLPMLSRIPNQLTSVTGSTCTEISQHTDVTHRRVTGHFAHKIVVIFVLLSMQLELHSPTPKLHISEMREYFCTKCCSFVQKTTMQKCADCAVFTWHTPNWPKRKL